METTAPWHSLWISPASRPNPKAGPVDLTGLIPNWPVDQTDVETIHNHIHTLTVRPPVSDLDQQLEALKFAYHLMSRQLSCPTALNFSHGRLPSRRKFFGLLARIDRATTKSPTHPPPQSLRIDHDKPDMKIEFLIMHALDTLLPTETHVRLLIRATSLLGSPAPTTEREPESAMSNNVRILANMLVRFTITMISEDSRSSRVAHPRRKLKYLPHSQFPSGQKWPHPAVRWRVLAAVLAQPAEFTCEAYDPANHTRTPTEMLAISKHHLRQLGLRLGLARSASPSGESDLVDSDADVDASRTALPDPENGRTQQLKAPKSVDCPSCNPTVSREREMIEDGQPLPASYQLPTQKPLPEDIQPLASIAHPAFEPFVNFVIAAARIESVSQPIHIRLLQQRVESAHQLAKQSGKQPVTVAVAKPDPSSPPEASTSQAAAGRDTDGTPPKSPKSISPSEHDQPQENADALSAYHTLFLAACLKLGIAAAKQFDSDTGLAVVRALHINTGVVGDEPNEMDVQEVAGLAVVPLTAVPECGDTPRLRGWPLSE